MGGTGLDPNRDGLSRIHVSRRFQERFDNRGPGWNGAPAGAPRQTLDLGFRNDGKDGLLPALQPQISGCEYRTLRELPGGEIALPDDGDADCGPERGTAVLVVHHPSAPHQQRRGPRIGRTPQAAKRELKFTARHRQPAPVHQLQVRAGWQKRSKRPFDLICANRSGGPLHAEVRDVAGIHTQPKPQGPNLPPLPPANQARRGRVTQHRVSGQCGESRHSGRDVAGKDPARFDHGTVIPSRQLKRAGGEAGC